MAVDLLERAPARIVAERRCSVRQSWTGYPMVQCIQCPAYRPQRALIADVSIGGVGLFVAKPYVAGAKLAILLRGLRRHESSIWAAEVIHATQLPRGHWLVGCRWHRAAGVHELRVLQEAD